MQREKESIRSEHKKLTVLSDLAASLTFLASSANTFTAEILYVSEPSTSWRRRCFNNLGAH